MNPLFYAEPGAGWGVRGGAPASDDPLTPECSKWCADFAAAVLIKRGVQFVGCRHFVRWA